MFIFIFIYVIVEILYFPIILFRGLIFFFSKQVFHLAELKSCLPYMGSNRNSHPNLSHLSYYLLRDFLIFLFENFSVLLGFLQVLNILCSHLLSKSLFSEFSS